MSLSRIVKDSGIGEGTSQSMLEFGDCSMDSYSEIKTVKVEE